MAKERKSKNDSQLGVGMSNAWALLDEEKTQKEEKATTPDNPEQEKNGGSDFFKNIEFYKRNDTVYSIVCIDDDLKALLQQLRGTRRYKGVKLNQLVSAIVRDFVERNIDSIKKDIKEGIPI